MSGLLEALNPVSGVLAVVKGIIGQFVADPQQKAQVELQLVQAQAELEKVALIAEQQLADAQAKVVIAEAQSDSWMAKNWRPITMLSFTGIVLWNYVVVPLASTTPVLIPGDMWSLLKLGIGGYIGARTLEKVGPDLVAAARGK